MVLKSGAGHEWREDDLPTAISRQVLRNCRPLWDEHDAGEQNEDPGQRGSYVLVSFVLKILKREQNKRRLYAVSPKCIDFPRRSKEQSLTYQLVSQDLVVYTIFCLLFFNFVRLNVMVQGATPVVASLVRRVTEKSFCVRDLIDGGTTLPTSFCTQVRAREPEWCEAYFP